MGSSNSTRMDDDSDIYSRTTSEEDSDGNEHNYVSFVGESGLRPGTGAVVMASPEPNEFYIGQRKPKIGLNVDTETLKNSEFALATRMAAGLGQQNRKFLPTNNISDVITNRERGIGPYHSFSYSRRNNLSNKFLPNTMHVLDEYRDKVFCGIFSKDGNNFITASQDRQIRLYNSETDSYKLWNTLSAIDVGWSIIDLAFSPDQSKFVYTTWSSSLHLCSVHENNEQEPLGLVDTHRRFCIFSVVFSSCGKELLGGANDGYLYIYDLQRHGRTLKILAHEYDVNSVAFADESSHIIYSGGDDGVVKVWDRRCLVEQSPKPVGVLAGHADGVTFIDSRGDGRHLISNSKDQSIKLWDVRVFSTEKAAENSIRAAHDQTWDYRWQAVPPNMFTHKDKIDGDTSIMTYKGHVVIKTLVRCRFSPIETTGQRYIYTGSGTGGFVIYDSLTGKIEETVQGHKSCVRDVDWHPTRNEIITSSWDGVVGRWTYSDQSLTQESRKTKRVKQSPKVQRLRRSARKTRATNDA